MLIGWGRPGGRALRLGALLVVAIISTTATARPSAQESGRFGIHEVRGGVLAHDVGGLWSGFRRENGVDFNVEVTLAKPAFALLGGTVRPNAGGSFNNQGDTSKLYAGLFWEIAAASGLFLDVGLGAALHDGALRSNEPTMKQLGARVLFRIPVEIGVAVAERHRLSFLFAHVSNGFLAYPNEGLDSLGFRYGYRF